MPRCATSVILALLATAAPSATAVGSARVVDRQQSVPVPRPFPGATAPPAAPPKTAEPAATAPPATAPPAPPAPATTAPAVQPAATPAPRASSSRPGAPDLGVQIYPASEFLESVDAGSGQRYYLYGTNASYLDIVAYYRTVLKSSGRELFKTPPMQQFDLGKFQDQTMAYPPSVVIKDYTGNGAGGYLFADGVAEKRFRTIIQIVPAGPR